MKPVSGLLVPRGLAVLDIPEELPPVARRVLSEAKARATRRGSFFVNQEMQDLAQLYEGGAEILGDDFFPCPDGEDPVNWSRLKQRLMIYINLLKACTRRLRSAVLGGTVRRTVVRNPYEEEIKAMMRGRFPAKMRTRLRNQILFGTSYAVPTIPRKGVVEPWLPWPPTTWVVTDGLSASNVLGIVNWAKDGSVARFVSVDAEGWVAPGGQYHVIPRAWGFLPVTFGFGEDLRDDGECLGLSQVREAAKAAIRATDCMFNVSMLQKLRTRGLLWISGRLENEQDDPAKMFGPNGLLQLGEGGQVGFATPSSNIPDSLEVLHAIVYALSITVGIPVDDLDPSLRGVDTSAEGAKRRYIPMASLVAEMAEACVLEEQDFTLRATGVLEVTQKGGPVDLDALGAQVSTDVDIDASVLPETNAERVANELQLLNARARTPYDFARIFNRGKDEAEIQAIAEAVEKQLNHEGTEDTEKSEPQNEEAVT